VTRQYLFICMGLFKLLFTSTAYACPLCHTVIAEEVREGIRATAQDGTVILGILSPFLTLAVVMGVLRRFPAGTHSSRISHYLDREKL